MGYNKKKSPPPQHVYTAKQALDKIKSYCAYQERCHSEVRTKLSGWYLNDDEIEQVIAQLISENYLNEQRFALAYAGGKFRIKKWGKNKIIASLKRKGISTPCIKIAIAGIDDDEYINAIKDLLTQKKKETKGKNIFRQKALLHTYLIGKGFENDLVYKFINEAFG